MSSIPIDYPSSVPTKSTLMAQHSLAYKLLWYMIFCLQQRVRIPETLLPDTITLHVYGPLALFPLHFLFVRQFNLPGMA